MRRSLLYVPGDARERLDKAPGRGADALIADLEDAVAPGAKGAARQTVADWVAAVVPGPEVWVRVNNHPDLLDDDIRAVALPGVHGISVPKVDSPAVLEHVDALLSAAEVDRGLPPRSLGVIALLESAAGVLRSAEIARAPRVLHLALGEADLTAELGLRPSDDSRELLPIRMQVVLASAAAGLAPPVGPVSTDFRDLDALRESTAALRRLGFRSRSCIHPAQVALVNDVFTPSAEEIARAQRLVELYDAAVVAGKGACVDDEGRMIDEAVVRSARQLL